MDFDLILAHAKDLPLADLRRLVAQLSGHHHQAEARTIATALLGRWPSATTLQLTENLFDNGAFLAPVAVLAADGSVLCDNTTTLGVLCDAELTEISDPAGNGAHPYLDLATAELRRDGSSNGTPNADATLSLGAELDAVTLQTLIAAAERAAETRGHPFDDDTLDEDVHDAASELGSTTNNGGLDTQIRFLAEQLGLRHVRVLLEGLGVTPGDCRRIDDTQADTAVVGYDRWEDFAQTLAVRAELRLETAGIDVERVPAERRAAIVASWRFGAFDERAANADAWWTRTGGPWFTRLEEQLIAEGYGAAVIHPLTAKLIERFGLTARTDAYPDRGHADLWSGSGVSPTVSRPGEGSDRVQRVLGDLADEVDAWGDGEYRIVWRVPAALALVTYCEGDVSVLQARSDDGWTAIQSSADRFYATH